MKTRLRVDHLMWESPDHMMKQMEPKYFVRNQYHFMHRIYNCIYKDTVSTMCVKELR